MRFSLPRLLLATIALIAASSSLHAASYLVRWTFDGDDTVDMSATTGFGPTTPITATASDAFGSVGVMSSGAAVGWAPAITSFNAGDYFQFTFALNVTDHFEVDTISFYARSFLNGASDWEVRSSVDAYSLVLGTGLTNVPGTRSLSDLGLSVESGASFTFRIYGLGGNADAFNGFVVDQVTVSGSTNAVPEPSTYALLLGGALLGWVMLRRHR